MSDRQPSKSMFGDDDLPAEVRGIADISQYSSGIFRGFDWSDLSSQRL